MVGANQFSDQLKIEATRKKRSGGREISEGGETTMWKIKPEFEDRMIRAGYGDDPWNKSFGKYFDIERGFHGYPGPLTKKVNK